MTRSGIGQAPNKRARKSCIFAPPMWEAQLSQYFSGLCVYCAVRARRYCIVVGPEREGIETVGESESARNKVNFHRVFFCCAKLLPAPKLLLVAARRFEHTGLSDLSPFRFAGKLFRAFGAWRMFIQRCEVQRKLGQRADRHYSRQLARKAILAWKSYTRLCFRIAVSATSALPCLAPVNSSRSQPRAAVLMDMA